METLFNSVQKQIENGMPELALIDEDFGQLQSFEDNYPVTFPCALIDIQEAAWTDAGKGMQTGDVTVKVKLAIDCYDDTHHRSGSQHKAITRMLFAKKLHKLLHRFAGRIIFDENMNAIDVHFSPLTRTRSYNYSVAKGIKVYEFTYRTGITDCDAVPVLTKTPRPTLKLEAI